MKSKSRNLERTPLVGSFLVLGKSILHLPRIVRRLNEEDARARNIIRELAEDIKSMESTAAKTNELVGKLQAKLDDTNHALTALSGSTPPKSINEWVKEDLFADNHNLDIFYANFEDKFRGTEEVIIDRLKEHLLLFKESGIDFAKFPVLDIGSGRGEFLSLLKQTGIKGVGIDINEDMVRRSNKKGFNTILGDAVDHLRKSKPQSYGAITGFHIVEHIPFPILIDLFNAAYTALAPGGFVLFETPNPENLIVASTTFYLDPSHLSPLPPALLEFTIKVCGFDAVEIRRLHPSEQLPIDAESLPDDIKNRLYGPQDYCVIGYKSSPHVNPAQQKNLGRSNRVSAESA